MSDWILYLLTGVAVALLTTTAVAVAEFLVVLAGPLALLVLTTAWAGRRGRRAWTALALLPCVVLTGVSAVVATPRAELAAATTRAELRDPDGLGSFTWLIQAVGIPLPPALERLT